MRRAYICDTAYQVFNMLNFHAHSQESISADFFVCDFFSTARTLFRKIRSEFAFDHMVLFSPHEPKEGEGRFHWYVRHAMSYLRPEKTAEESIIEGNADLSGYEEIFASTVTVFVACLLQINKGAKLYLIDEGVGGYSGDPVTGNLSWRQKLFSAVFRRGASVVRPECTYMYNVRNAEKHTSYVVKQMPALDEMYLEKARRIFGMTAEAGSSGRKILWITHADEMEKSTETLDRQVSGFLKDYRDRILVRKHPRDDRRDLYEDFILDDSGQMWELMIPLLGMDDMTLIGTFSTAQMTPKLLYDREPRVLFLCPFYRDIYTSEQYEEIMEAIREFQELYRDPSKIVFIRELKELGEYL